MRKKKYDRKIQTNVFGKENNCNVMFYTFIKVLTSVHIHTYTPHILPEYDYSKLTWLLILHYYTRIYLVGDIQCRMNHVLFAVWNFKIFPSFNTVFRSFENRLTRDKLNDDGRCVKKTKERKKKKQQKTVLYTVFSCWHICVIHTQRT